MVKPNGPVSKQEIIQPEKSSLKGQTIEELLESNSVKEQAGEGSIEKKISSVSKTDKISPTNSFKDKFSSRKNSLRESALDSKEPIFPVEIKIEHSKREAPIYENMNYESAKEIVKPVEISIESASEKSESTDIKIRNKYLLEFLYDFNLVFVIDDSSTMNEIVKRPIELSFQSNLSKWDELKLIFGTLTEIVPNLNKSEIYLLDDKPLGMNSIDKLFKVVLANHEKKENQTKNLLIIFLTDVKVTQDLNKSDNLSQTLYGLPSNVYTCIINFSEDEQTNEYLNRLSCLLPNVTNDDLSSIRNVVEQQASIDPNKFRFNYADYLAKLLIESACHLKV